MRPTLGLFALVGFSTPVFADVVVSGTVFSDRDGDGVFSSGDEPLPGVAVFWERDRFATSDAAGAYSLSVPSTGILWVRTPDGFSPAPTWTKVELADGDVTRDLGLDPSSASGPVFFVQGADSHQGTVSSSETERALRAAVDVVPAPHFLTITGDITAGTMESEFQDFLRALEAISTPFVPVVGNHDWHDDGFLYRQIFGPPSYSFDSGGVHFVVLNFMAPPADELAFLDLDLTTATTGVPLVVFYHSPVEESFGAALAARGVGWVFTGHAHANRIMRFDGLLDVNTETMVMGGIDYTPAGYRLVFLGEDGALHLEHRVTVDARYAELVHPAPYTCVRPGATTAIAAVEIGAARPDVSLSLDGAAEVPMTHAGAWTYVADVELAPGVREARLTVRGGAGPPIQRELRFCAAPELETSDTGGSWPQLGGSARHHNAVAEELPPPLHVEWARTLGGHSMGGPPVVEDGLIFAPVVDLADETRGGVVALDLLTGETRWESRTGAAVRNSPAVADGIVVVGSTDGMVRGYAAATGEVVWTVDLAGGARELSSFLYAAPTIAEGTVYVGVQSRFAALDVGTGEILWSVDPQSPVFAVTYAGAAVDSGVGVALVGRGNEGIWGFDVTSGVEMWRIGRPTTLALNGSPVIDGQTVFLTNVQPTVTAVDLTTGAEVWARDLSDFPDVDWRFGVMSTPALAGGALLVPTPYRGLSALDASSGRLLWESGSGSSAIFPLPYGTEASGYIASPVVTGGVVWIGGIDGMLRALDARSGDVLWSRDLGAPVMVSPVPAGRWLVVATWDGTVRGMTLGDPSGSYFPGDEGCSCRIGRRPAPVSAWVLFAAAAWLARAGRGARPRPSRRVPPGSRTPRPAAAADRSTTDR